ncbi:MAG: 2'-5' RNA ligase [Gammaproteobacteria bacterium RIFCSPHIGHO2_12_FULL_38_14]|nr:MAG: 2'-5' RNA ligase [Gammaproteobacteria bacterium RIFCSPHIGHO2_12_FULL_38_14]
MSKTHHIRWTKSENLHITLQFLPEVLLDDLPRLVDAVKLVLQSMPPINITCEALYLFPHPYLPRVIVLTMNPQSELAALSELIGQGIETTGYSTEKRPFRAHLTLGRIKHTHHLDLHFLQEIDLPKIAPMEINEVILFQSDPMPDGSRYTVLKHFALGPASN